MKYPAIISAALLLSAAPIMAQGETSETSPAPALTNEDAGLMIDDVMERGISSYAAKPADNGDVSQCDGGSNTEIYRAMFNCYPVYRTYQLLEPLLAAFDDYISKPAATATERPDEAAQLTALADAVILSADSHDYPAQDAPVLIAYISRTVADIGMNRPEAALANLDAADALVKSSRIEDESFATVAGLGEIRKVVEIMLTAKDEETK